MEVEIKTHEQVGVYTHEVKVVSELCDINVRAGWDKNPRDALKNYGQNVLDEISKLQKVLQVVDKELEELA